MGKVLVLGGYGNFGKRIAHALVKKNIKVIIAGRNLEKAQAFAAELPPMLVETKSFDVDIDLELALATLQPTVVINTCGPFQFSDYSVAKTCIQSGVHYIDLADSRDFVAGISSLDSVAKLQNVAVITGASSVPALSSAVIEHYCSEYSAIESLRYGIAPGQNTERGLATTQAILSYVGKRMRPFAGAKSGVFGWQDTYAQVFPELGTRFMSNCEVPDLDLLPDRYGIESIRFSAGLELKIMHLALSLMSWVIRVGFPIDLPKYAELLLNVSGWFDSFGTDKSGMHMIMAGKDHDGAPRIRSWFVIAKSGHGLQIPTIPSVILAEKIIRGAFVKRGAMPAVGLVSLDEYLEELRPFDISVQTSVKQAAI